MAEEVVLKIVEGNLKGEEFVFDEKGLCLIGRSADCALQIPKEKDMKISRRHCLLILDPPNVRIRDLGSRNGTYVNSEALKPGVVSSEPEKESPVDRVLKDKDVVEIGECVFLVEIPTISVPEPKIPVLPQIKPQVAGVSPNVPQATAERDPLSPKFSPNAVRPATVSHLSPPKPTSTGNGIAVTEVMSRDEIKGATSEMRKIAYTSSVENPPLKEQQLPHGISEELKRHNTPQSPLTAHPGVVPAPRSPQETVVKTSKQPQPVIIQSGSHSSSQGQQPPVPTIKQPGVVPAQPVSSSPVPVIKQPGRITNSFSPVNKMTDPGPLSPPPPQTQESQIPKKPTIVLTKKKAPGESGITLTPKKGTLQGKTVLKAKIVSKPVSKEQGQNVVSLTPKSSGVSNSPVAEQSATPAQTGDSSLGKTPTDKIETIHEAPAEPQVPVKEKSQEQPAELHESSDLSLGKTPTDKIETIHEAPAEPQVPVKEKSQEQPAELHESSDLSLGKTPTDKIETIHEAPAEPQAPVEEESQEQPAELHESSDVSLSNTDTDKIETIDQEEEQPEESSDTSTDKIEPPDVVDKYQDTIVMDPVEMDSMPDLVSSTIPEGSNPKRVASFKIRGVK